MKVLLLGPLGSGKSTQAQQLSRALSYFQVSTGNLIRAHIQSDTELGRSIKDCNDRGELVPDDVILRITLPNLEPAGRWILDGFPRNEAQAQALNEALKRRGISLSRVIALEAPDGELIERIKGRRQSLATGWTYHLEHDPPPKKRDDLDAGPFVPREDDTAEAVRRQLEIYHQEVEPLKQHYEKQGILTVVDARKPIPEVTEDILQALRPARAD
ncbi:MAG: nucleoside monophosphate kinase [Rubrobacter sp.]|nr:nucleoside monophosphate kinase [Rubrobacter sp.]